MTPKLSKIFPESCLLIFVGVLIGALLLSTHSVHVQPLTPDTFFLYMLPPIILDAGYFMPNRLFFDHLGTILLFAVVGTVFNTLTIGKLSFISIKNNSYELFLSCYHTYMKNMFYCIHWTDQLHTIKWTWMSYGILNKKLLNHSFICNYKILLVVKIIQMIAS